MRREHFDLERASLRVTLPAADVTVVHGGTGLTVEIDGSDADHVNVSQNGDRVVVDMEGRLLRRSRLDVRITTGGEITEAEIKVALGDVRVDVATSVVRVEATAGDVSIGAPTTRADIKTASGDVSVGEAGEAAVKTASGDVKIAKVDTEAGVVAASGDVAVGRNLARATIRTAAGDVRVDAHLGDVLEVKTMAGDVTIGLPRGRTYDAKIKSMSGSVRSEFPDDDSSERLGGGRLVLTTMAGNVTLRPAD